ncbi:MAG: hypothetical protein O2999_13770 [Nitrospirae bacterium]|nr:hypothetical protein [Nitrospirota bacterium]MDA1305336.1 hypothetical protein [Nitrospirota bacterium]
MNRILIPGERDASDDEWETPFMMHVSPVSTADKAYYVRISSVVYNCDQTKLSSMAWREHGRKIQYSKNGLMIRSSFALV